MTESTGPLPEWPVPQFFERSSVAQVWRVPYGERAAMARGWAREHGIRPAHTDQTRIALLLVDVQNTFCVPGFELFVAGRSGTGAVDDNVRLCEFIYRHLGRLTQIFATMDTHAALQIFHPVFWVDAAGALPEPYTQISVDDVRAGRWRINPAAAPLAREAAVEDLQEYARHYVERLAQGGKYQLTVWPYHAMLGGIGHALVSAVEEALFFHSVCRSAPTVFETKGGHPLTEHYSALRPEVLEGPQGQPIGRRSQQFLHKLLDFDMVIIAGQAKSHCVAWTVDDLLAELSPTRPQLARKVYLLEDCTSPVVVPGVVDFTEQAEAAFRRFADAGMHIVRSTDPMERWPEVPGPAPAVRG